MKPLAEFPIAHRRQVLGVFADIDDTLTTDGRLTAQAYAAMERLRDRGLLMVPVTGRPAGWCDHMARMWPVDGIVGENGAFYYRYHHEGRRMERHYAKSAEERGADRVRLDAIAEHILAEIPGAAVSADQPYREADLAIDYCEDVSPLPAEDVERIVALFEEAGATAKVSSIHINGWFGAHDKLTMTRTLMERAFGVDLDPERTRYVFVGDSPNDAPLFGYFPNAVGVANVRDFAGTLEAEPAYVTEARAGAGFAELARAILEARG
jgi:HAD superfamily hydrolase (TIGR01484 family)